MNPEILLVDDDAVQASVRSTILARAGWRIVVARNGREALLLLDRALRLMLTDHLMPGMNGPELVRIARSSMPDLPVLVLSGLADAEQEYEGLNVSFHLKPFPPEQLIRTVTHLINNPTARSA